MEALKAELLYDTKIELEPPQPLGATPQGNRQIYYVRSGTFEGPRLKGEVLPGGGDWFLIRPDGVGELDVRATFRTHDGALIYVTYRGLLAAPPSVWERLARREEVPRGEYYFYTAPMFQTSAPNYDWLNRLLAVGYGYAIPGGVAYRVFALV